MLCQLQGYKSAGQLDAAMDTLMWASEFLMEAHFFKAKVQVSHQASMSSRLQVTARAEADIQLIERLI